MEALNLAWTKKTKKKVLAFELFHFQSWNSSDAFGFCPFICRFLFDSIIFSCFVFFFSFRLEIEFVTKRCHAFAPFEGHPSAFTNTSFEHIDANVSNRIIDIFLCFGHSSSFASSIQHAFNCHHKFTLECYDFARRTNHDPIEIRFPRIGTTANIVRQRFE